MVEIKKNYVGVYEFKRVSRDGKSMTMRVNVRVKLERRNFGRSDVLITPISGSGEFWVEKEMVLTNKDET